VPTGVFSLAVKTVVAHTGFRSVTEELLVKRKLPKHGPRQAAGEKKFSAALKMVHRRFGHAMKKLAQ
jgi:hypothetical protein